MYALTHPSLPNYLALTGGSTFGIDSDCTDCSVSTTGLADQFAGRGLSWKAYMEGLPYPCFTGPAPATTSRILAGSHPAGRLLDVRSALGGGQMMQRFVPAEHPDRAKRLIRALASHTDVYTGVLLRARHAGGRDAVTPSHLAFVEIDAPDALARRTHRAAISDNSLVG